MSDVVKMLPYGNEIETFFDKNKIPIKLAPAPSDIVSTFSEVSIPSQTAPQSPAQYATAFDPRFEVRSMNGTDAQVKIYEPYTLNGPNLIPRENDNTMNLVVLGLIALIAIQLFKKG